MSKLSNKKVVATVVTTFLFLFCFSGFSKNIPNKEKVLVPYYVSKQFDNKKTFLIDRAALYISSRLSCVKLVKSKSLKEGVVSVVPMEMPAKNKAGRRTHIGLYSRKHKKIKIALTRFNNTGERYPIPDRYFFKVILHEFAHSLGMNREHAFPERFRDISQLTPLISDNSDPKLYQNDIEFLQGVVCDGK